MKRPGSLALAWVLALGLMVWAGTAEARPDHNPWTEARRDLERAQHALEGLDDNRAKDARRDVDKALRRVREGESKWTAPQGGGRNRQACADEVVQRLKVDEEDVRVRRDSKTGDTVRVNWWAHKSHNREKSGHCIVRNGGVVQFRRD